MHNTHIHQTFTPNTNTSHRFCKNILFFLKVCTTHTHQTFTPNTSHSCNTQHTSFANTYLWKREVCTTHTEHMCTHHHTHHHKHCYTPTPNTPTQRQSAEEEVRADLAQWPLAGPDVEKSSPCCPPTAETWCDCNSIIQPLQSAQVNRQQQQANPAEVIKLTTPTPTWCPRKHAT